MQLCNRQRRDAVPLSWLSRLARRAVRRLRIHPRGKLVVSFIDAGTMRRLNRRFLGHWGVTDVLTFRYSQEPLGRALRSARHFRSEGHQGRAECRHRRGAGLASEDGTGSVAGEILIAPACAKRYARQHGLGYREELARYIVHGLLHWVGHDDATPLQQRRMRALEDQLLACCGVRS